MAQHNYLVQPHPRFVHIPKVYPWNHRCASLGGPESGFRRGHIAREGPEGKERRLKSTSETALPT
eukprot:3438997-Pyramimonas_sp.AAC.1